MPGFGSNVAATLLRIVRTLLLGLAALIALVVVWQYFAGFPHNPTVYQGLALLTGVGLGCGFLARLFERESRK